MKTLILFLFTAFAFAADAPPSQPLPEAETNHLRAIRAEVQILQQRAKDIQDRARGEIAALEDEVQKLNNEWKVVAERACKTAGVATDKCVIDVPKRTITSAK